MTSQIRSKRNSKRATLTPWASPSMYCFLLLVLLLASHNYHSCHALIPHASASNNNVRPSASSSSIHHLHAPNIRFDSHHADSNRFRRARQKMTELREAPRPSDNIPRGGGGEINNNNSNSSNKNDTILQSSIQSIKKGYQQRISADPSFLSKSILEIILAASTQYMAEVTRRGWSNMKMEMDFVFAGVVTAVCGKYYSMWRVAKTVNVDVDLDLDLDVYVDAGATATNNNSNTKSNNNNSNNNNNNNSDHNWRNQIPTNAFQPTLLDGITPPTFPSRILAFFLPMPQLFRAGVISSTIGYGFTSFLTSLRTIFMNWGLLPFYEIKTRPVSVPLAAVYTGVFMAVVSNIRYQVLQGVVEPYFIDGVFDRLENMTEKMANATGRIKGLSWVSRLLHGLIRIKFWRQWKGLMIVLVRWGNGLLGSWIAIGGMKACGLQKMKE